MIRAAGSDGVLNAVTTWFGHIRMTGAPTGFAVQVNWRPGCPSCRALLRPLRRSRIRMVEISADRRSIRQDALRFR